MTLKTTLIDVKELAALAPDDVLIVDCRFDLMAPGTGARDVGKGQRDYREGHIPGAVYASLDTDLSDLSRKVSTKNLARQIGAKSVEPCKPEVANRHIVTTLFKKHPDNVIFRALYLIFAREISDLAAVDKHMAPVMGAGKLDD